MKFPFYRLTINDIALVHTLYKQWFPVANKYNQRTVYNRKASRLAGIAGELAFFRYCNGGALYVGNRSFEYDFIILRNQKTVDVKTKMRRVDPQPQHSAGVWDYQKNKVDYYAFLSTVEDLSVVWFCGWVGQADFKNHPQRRQWEKGDVDPSNGMKFEADNITIPYAHLPQFQLRPPLEMR